MVGFLQLHPGWLFKVGRGYEHRQTNDAFMARNRQVLNHQGSLGTDLYDMHLGKGVSVLSANSVIVCLLVCLFSSTFCPFPILYTVE